MKLSLLSSLYPKINIFSDDTDIQLSMVKRGSVDFEVGDVFIAIKGTTWDGHSFIPTASGKSSLIVMEDKAMEPLLIDAKQNYLLVEDTREALGRICNHLASKPTEEMYCVGITGTNGKTTTNYCVEEVLNSIGNRTAVMGTIDHHLGGKLWETNLTSPGPVELYSRLLEMKNEGANALCMEISSHALDQKRNHSVALDVAIFTNFTQDHLDYHGSMNEYLLAKTKIFSEVLFDSNKENKLLLVNGDDPSLSALSVPEGIRCVYFGKSSKCDLSFELIEQSFSGMRFLVSFKSETYEFSTKLIGEFNLYNLTAAIGVGLHRGVKLKSLVSTIANISGVCGRLEPVPSRKDIFSFVDFAHTPDALSSSLSFLHSIKELLSNGCQIITVFGAGGDRDKTKRPLMAEAVEKYSDICVVCSDNPRTENPDQILNDIKSGFSRSYLEKVVVIEDRRAAIEKAVSLAEKGDVVLVSGKGHEPYQEIGTQRYHFSDQEELRKLRGK